MTASPPNLLAVATYWRSQGGVNLGIVGNAAHTTGYHLGSDRLHSGDYSTRTARDRAGLSVYAAAIDLGRVDGGYAQLRRFSVWLVEQARHNADDTRDIREVIYSPDGTQVLRWDRERGIGSRPEDGEADASHRTHTHISYYRDSRSRDQVGPFRRFFEPAPLPGHHVRIAHGAIVRAYRLGPEGPDGIRCILKVDGHYGVDERWTGPTTTYAAEKLAPRRTCDKRSGARTAVPTEGPYKDRCIRVGAAGVTAA